MKKQKKGVCLLKGHLQIKNSTLNFANPGNCLFIIDIPWGEHCVLSREMYNTAIMNINPFSEAFAPSNALPPEEESPSHFSAPVGPVLMREFIHETSIENDGDSQSPLETSVRVFDQMEGILKGREAHDLVAELRSMAKQAQAFSAEMVPFAALWEPELKTQIAAKSEEISEKIRTLNPGQRFCMPLTYPEAHGQTSCCYVVVEKLDDGTFYFHEIDVSSSRARGEFDKQRHASFVEKSRLGRSFHLNADALKSILPKFIEFAAQQGNFEKLWGGEDPSTQIGHEVLLDGHAALRGDLFSKVSDKDPWASLAALFRMTIYQHLLRKHPHGTPSELKALVKRSGEYTRLIELFNRLGALGALHDHCSNVLTDPAGDPARKMDQLWMLRESVGTTELFLRKYGHRLKELSADAAPYVDGMEALLNRCDTTLKSPEYYQAMHQAETRNAFPETIAPPPGGDMSAKIQSVLHKATEADVVPHIEIVRPEIELLKRDYAKVLNAMANFSFDTTSKPYDYAGIFYAKELMSLLPLPNDPFWAQGNSDDHKRCVAIFARFLDKLTEQMGGSLSSVTDGYRHFFSSGLEEQILDQSSAELPWHIAAPFAAEVTNIRLVTFWLLKMPGGLGGATDDSLSAYSLDCHVFELFTANDACQSMSAADRERQQKVLDFYRHNKSQTVDFSLGCGTIDRSDSYMRSYCNYGGHGPDEGMSQLQRFSAACPGFQNVAGKIVPGAPDGQMDKFFEERKWAYVWARSVDDTKYVFEDQCAHWESVRKILGGIPGPKLLFNEFYPHQLPSVQLESACVQSDQLPLMWDYWDERDKFNWRCFNDENHVSALDPWNVTHVPELVCDGRGAPAKLEYHSKRFLNGGNTAFAEHPLFYEIGKALSVPGTQVYSLFDIINSHLDLFSRFGVDDREQHGKTMLLALLDNMLLANFQQAERPESIPNAAENRSHYVMDGQLFRERPFASRPVCSLADEIERNPEKLFRVLQDTYNSVLRLHLEMKPFQRPDVHALCYMAHLIHQCQEIHMEIHGCPFSSTEEPIFPSVELRLQQLDEIERKFGRTLGSDEQAILHLARVELAVERMKFFTDGSKIEEIDDGLLVGFYGDVFASRALKLQGIPHSCYKTICGTVPELGGLLQKSPNKRARIERSILASFCQRMGGEVPKNSWVDFNNFHVFWGGHEIRTADTLTSARDYQRLFGPENREFIHSGEWTSFTDPAYGNVRLSYGTHGQVISTNFGKSDQWWQYAPARILQRALQLPNWLCSETYTAWMGPGGQLQVRDRKHPEIIYFQSQGSGPDWKLECTFEPYKGLFLAPHPNPQSVTWLSRFENEKNCAFFVDAHNKLQKVWAPRYDLCFELRDDKWMQRGTDYQLVDVPEMYAGPGGNKKSNPLGSYKNAIFLHNTKQPGSYKVIMPAVGLQSQRDDALDDAAPDGVAQMLGRAGPIGATVSSAFCNTPTMDKPFIGTATPVEAHFVQRREEPGATRLDGLSNDGNLQLGVIFLLQGDYDQAAEYFKRLHAGAALSPVHHQLMIDCLLEGRRMKGYSGKVAAVHMLLLEKWAEMYGLNCNDIAVLKPREGALKFENEPLGTLLETYLKNLPSMPLQLRMDPRRERRLLEHLASIGILNPQEPIIAKRLLSLDHFLRPGSVAAEFAQPAERLRHYDPLLAKEEKVQAMESGSSAAHDLQVLPMQDELFRVGTALGGLRRALVAFHQNPSPAPASPLHFTPADYLKKLSPDDRDTIGDAFQKSLEELNGEIQTGAEQLALKRARNEELKKVPFDCDAASQSIEVHRQKMRAETRKLHEELLALVNKPSPMLMAQDVVVCSAPIKLKAVIAAYGQFATRVPPDTARFFHFLKKYNPSITPDDVPQIMECSHQYMRHKIMFRRMANLMQVIQDLQRAGGNDGARRSACQSRLFDQLEEWDDTYNPESYPYALLNEYVSGKHARRGQIDILKKLCDGLGAENPTDTVIQMQMGAGKTSVVIPTYAARVAQQRKLPFVCAHNQSQFDALRAELAPSFSRLNIRVVSANFTLQDTREPWNLEWLLREMQMALEERDRVFVIDPTTIEILEAQFKLLARKPQRNKTDELCLQTLLDIFKLLGEDAIFIGDEIDRILNPLEYLNVSLPPAAGQLPGMPQAHLDFISDVIISVAEICPELRQNQQHLMAPDRVQEVLRRLSQNVLEEKFAIQIPDEMRNSFHKYVLGQFDNVPETDTATRQEANAFLAFLQQQKEQGTAASLRSYDRILIARGLLGTLLPHLFTQKYNQNFGFGLDGACIPFKGPNEPNLGSEFKNCYQTACCFFAGISIDGVPLRMLESYVDMLSRLVADEESQRKAFDEFDEIFKDCNYEDRPVTVETLVTTADPSTRKKICECLCAFLRQDTQISGRQKVARIFAQKSIHFSTQSVESKSAQFPRLFSRTVGFSGTMANKGVYNFAKVDIQLQAGSDGQVIARNCELMGARPQPIQFVDNGEARPTAKMLLEAHVGGVTGLRALIDAGALLNGQHPRDVARDILAFAQKDIPDVRHVLYYDPDRQTFFVLCADRTEPIAIRPMNREALAAVVNDFNALFAYYDEQRCTGTDLPLPIDCHALQTLDPSWLTTDRNAQANIRPRAFLSSQTIDYMALEKSRPQFLRLADGGEPTAADIYATLQRNQSRSIIQQYIRASYDKVDTLVDDFIRRTAIALASDPWRLSIFSNAVGELLTKVDDFSPEAMFFALQRTMSLNEAVEAYYNRKVQLLKTKLEQSQLLDRFDEQAAKTFNETKVRILQGTEGICVTVGADNYAGDVDASVQVEVQEQTEVEVNCNISVNLQLEEFLTRVGYGDRLDPKEEDLLIIDGPTDMHTFFADKSRSVPEQIREHGGPMDPKDREIYSQFDACFPSDLYLSRNFAQSCETEHTVFDRTQKHCSYLVITWESERTNPRAIAVSKQEYDTLRAKEGNLQNCCIYLAGTGTCLHGQIPDELKEFRQRKLCELALFNANIPYLLTENSDLVAQVMAADGEGHHDPKLLNLRQNYLLLRTPTQDREDVRTTISHSRPLGMGCGKTWPDGDGNIPVREDIAVVPDRPSKSKIMQVTATRKILHPRWAIALTIISGLLLIAAALALVFTNIIGILAIGIWGYALLFFPGAASGIAAVALWIPRWVG